MAISLPQGFRITSKESIDDRIILTKEQMLSLSSETGSNRMPDNYICVCKDDGKLYIYNKNNEPDEEIGLFKSYEEVIDIPAAIKAGMSGAEGKEAMAEAVAGTLPAAMKDVMKNEESAQEFVDNVFNNEQFDLGLDDKVEIKVEELISLIQAIDGTGK